MFPTKILLATGGSSGDQTAIEAATELAVGTGSELHVVRCVSLEIERPYPALSARYSVREILERRKLRALVALDEHAGLVRKLGGSVAGSYYREGKLDRETVRLGEEMEAGLIVVGGREFGRVWKAFARFLPFFEDHACKIQNRAHCPVLVIRA